MLSQCPDAADASARRFVPVQVSFTPNSAAVYTGTLTVDSQTFTLTATAANPPLPSPMLQFDTKTPQSGQQVTLTMTLAAPAPFTVSGSILLAFQPDPSLAAFVTDDPTVNFVATGARSVPFSIQQGSTLATLGGQNGAGVSPPARRPARSPSPSPPERN